MTLLDDDVISTLYHWSFAVIYFFLFYFHHSAALRQAIQEGDVMLVRRALAVPGFNPDDVAIDTASGMTLLMWAATSGQDEIVRLLLRRGAGVNTVQKRTAMTALLHAAEQVHINGNSPRATHSYSSDNERKLLFTHSCSFHDNLTSRIRISIVIGYP